MTSRHLFDAGLSWLLDAYHTLTVTPENLAKIRAFDVFPGAAAVDAAESANAEALRNFLTGARHGE